MRGTAFGLPQSELDAVEPQFVIVAGGLQLHVPQAPALCTQATKSAVHLCTQLV